MFFVSFSAWAVRLLMSFSTGIFSRSGLRKVACAAGPRSNRRNRQTKTPRMRVGMARWLRLITNVPSLGWWEDAQRASLDETLAAPDIFYARRTCGSPDA